MSEVATSAAPAPPRIQPHESFFDARKRNRRATWRMGAACAASALLMGIPLTLVITPAIYACGFFAAALLNHFFPLPPWMIEQANRLAALALRSLGFFLSHQSADRSTVLLGAAVLLAPGAILSLALWSLILGLFRRAGVGGTLIHLGARAPDPQSNKELQLNNILDEMAIAARLPRVQAMFVKGPAVNAAAVGTSIHDAHVVVTEGLLESLSREELEATIAHLVASIGNGDLSIAFTISSVFETCGLILTLINAPFESEARSALWRMARYGMRFGRTVGSEEADALDAMLTRDMDFDSGINRFFDAPSARWGVLGKIARFALFPIFLTNFSIQLTLWFFSAAALGPAMALLWRARRYLADASTVQFTRDPDGFGSAIVKLNEIGGGPSGAGWASHLFVVSPYRSDRMAPAHPSPATPPSNPIAAEVRADLEAARHGDQQAMARLQTLSAAVAAERKAEPGDERVGVESRSMLSFHPSIKHRLERLNRMGAHVAIAETPAGLIKFIVALSLLLGPFAALAAGLILLLIAVFVLFNLVILVLWIAAIHALVGLLV